MDQSHLINQFLNENKDHIWIVDRDLKLIYANNNWLNVVKAVTGVDKQLNESAFEDGFGEGYNEKWEAYYNRGLKGEYFQIEEHYADPNTNKIHYGQVSFEPLKDEDDNIIAVACVSRDITRIVQQRSAADQLIDASLDIFCTINEQGNFVYVSAASKNQWGYLPEELIDTPYVNLIVEEDLSKTSEIAADILSGQDVKSFINRYKRKDGSIAYNSWSVRYDKHAQLMYCVVRDAQEKLAQEEKVLHSEQRFKALVQEGSDLVSILDADGNYVYVSPTSTALIGIPPENFIGKNALEFIHPVDIEKAVGNLQKISSSARVNVEPYRFRNNENEWRWIETVLTNMLDNPAVKGIVANSRDITERKKLKELNLQVEQLAKIGGWELDLTSMTPTFSEETYRIHGLPFGTPPKVEDGMKFYAPEVQPIIQEAVKEAIENHIPYDIELPFINAKDENLWVRTVGKVELNDGKAVKLYGTIQDITDRKEVENRLQALADNLPGIVFQYLIYPDGKDAFNHVSGAIEHLWGFTAKQVANNSNLIWDQIKAAGNYESVKNSIQKSIETKSKWTSQIRYMMPSGEIRTNLGFGSPIFLADGTVLFNSIVLDITKEVKNEQLLEQVTKIARIGSWELDLDNHEGDNMYWSPMLFDIVEVDQDYNPTLSGGIEFHIGESRARIQKALELLIKEGTEFDVEILLRTAKGNKRWSRAIGKSETVNGKRTKIYGSYQDIHKRKMAELELMKAKEKAEESDAKFKAYTEQSPIAIFTINIDGECVYANETWLEMSGMKLDQVLGKGWIKAIHPDDREFVRTNWEKSIQSGSHWSYEYRIKQESGKIVWVKGSAKELFNEKKRLVGYLGTNLNITEKKKAQEEKNNLQDTIENSLNEIYIFDAESFRFKYLNRGALLNLGYSEQEIKSLTALDIKPEYDLKSFKALITPLVKGEKEKIIFFTDHQRKDGSRYPVEVHLQLVTEGNNKRFLAIILDITARIKAEKENRFKANLLSMIGQSAIATDLDGTVNYWNKAAEDIYGWKEEEAIGENIMNLTTPETSKEQAKEIMAELKQGESWSGEFNVHKKGGSTFPARITNSPIYNEDHKLSGIIGISSDITEEVKNKELLTKYTSELERSNAELEQFAFIVSHDLQEPLRMVTGFMDQLSRKYSEQLDEKAHQYIHYATDGAKRMKQIILDILTYSRAGRINEGEQEVNLNELLDEFKQLRRNLISESNATIKAGKLPTLNISKAAITQVLHCLLDNALKYSAEGTNPIVEIKVTENTKEWKFSIEDNGIGIDPKFYDKIFVMFQRLHNRDKFPGTGIGLSIAKRHIEYLGGTIWLTSELGKGTTFYFTIPKN